jgi:hypothetical protein
VHDVSVTVVTETVSAVVGLVEKLVPFLKSILPKGKTGHLSWGDAANVSTTTSNNLLTALQSQYGSRLNQMNVALATAVLNYISNRSSSGSTWTIGVGSPTGLLQFAKDRLAEAASGKDVISRCLWAVTMYAASNYDAAKPEQLTGELKSIYQQVLSEATTSSGLESYDGTVDIGTQNGSGGTSDQAGSGGTSGQGGSGGTSSQGGSGGISGQAGFGAIAAILLLGVLMFSARKRG